MGRTQAREEWWGEAMICVGVEKHTQCEDCFYLNWLSAACIFSCVQLFVTPRTVAH